MKEVSQSRSGKSKQSPSKQPVSGKQKSAKNIDSEQRRQMIAETAYFMAEARGFNGECQLDDWLQAEAMVDSRYSGQQPS